MSDDKTGGSAFPRNELHYQGGGFKAADGMTLRDYMAGQALVGIMSTCIGEVEPYWDVISKDCYAMADAMLEAREGS